MSEVIVRFLNLEVLNYHWFIPWAILVVWLALLIAAFSSLRSLAISFKSRVTWGLLILFLPLIGLAIYALRCLFCGDWSFLKPLLQSKSEAVRMVTNPNVRMRGKQG